MSICIHGNLDAPLKYTSKTELTGCCICYPFPAKGHPMTTPTQKFTKKPVTIEAVRFVELSRTQRTHGESVEYNSSEIASFMGCILNIRTVPGKTNEGRTYIEIPTLEGIMEANVGDWIIKGVKGEFYPCKPDIFEATYSPALAAQPELLEPVGEIKREGVVKVNFFESCTYGCALPDGTKLYTAAQLQQVVEDERHRFGVIDALLKEYGLQAVDFVADFKQALNTDDQDDEEFNPSEQYAKRDHQALDKAGGYFMRHMSAMTGEGLHSKSRIAGELAWRDSEIDRLKAQAKREPMTREQMREIFLANGFTVKVGRDDLKDYVYAAGRAIEAHHGIGGEA